MRIGFLWRQLELIKRLCTMVLESGRAELAFVDGVGMLAPSAGTLGVEPLWVNDLLNKSMHVQDVGHGQSEFILYDNVLQKSVRRSSVMGKHSVSTLSLPGPPAFNGELYAFQLSPNGGCGPRSFISLPYVQNFILGTSKHNKWICKGLHRWEALLAPFGVDGERHFVCSSKAAAARSKRAARAEPPPPGAATAQEYGASGMAFLLLLAHWSDSANQVLPENNKAATELLRVFTERIFERNVFQVSFNISQTAFMLYFREGKCKLGIVGGADNACAQALAALDLLDTEFAVHELVLQLHQFCAKSWRAHKDVKRCVYGALFQLALAFQNLLQDMGPEAWQDTSPLNLPVLRLSTSKRARRVSKSYKHSLVEATHGISKAHQPSQMVGAVRIWNKKRLREEVMLSDSAARNLIRDHMLLYLAASRHTFGKARHCSISLDGLRAGGNDMMQLAFYDVDADLACWLPPQAGS